MNALISLPRLNFEHHMITPFSRAWAELEKRLEILDTVPRKPHAEIEILVVRTRGKGLFYQAWNSLGNQVPVRRQI